MGLAQATTHLKRLARAFSVRTGKEVKPPFLFASAAEQYEAKYAPRFYAVIAGYAP